MRKSRVLVAAAGLLLGLVVVWLRVGWLQIVRHAYYAERADLNQEQRVLLKPARGNLLDRAGAVLARDLETYSVSGAPREMADPRRTARALADLLDEPPARLVRAFAERRRFVWIKRRIAPALAEKIAARRERGIYLATEVQRVYPLGEAAAEILGRTDLDANGVDGLELQLDPALRGRPGWATMFRDGAGRSMALPGGLRRSPEDGQHVVLTLDADLQCIVEAHLAAAVDSLHARRGFAMFMDPRTGEVLAAAVAPHLAPGKARNWNFTDQFEPGSTYKPVVVGAALEEGLAEPDQVFEASASGVAQVAPGTLFHDVHEQASFTFRDAVRFSSNIVMGKVGNLVGAERLYRYSTALGFGSITGIAFPGEAGGRLRSPEHWSARSTPTIAIGHEVSVTPLQLTLAYSAIANGGVMMRPMLVREIRDAGGQTVRRFTPEASHRVFSERTSATIRELLTAVVDSGTAKAARVPGFPIAGKTGTAQKYDPSVGTYGKGLYLSSFAGFAPAESPRMVGVVVIDEPRGKYYGGEVAAPIFRQVIEDLRRLPRGPLGSGVMQVAARPPAPAPVVVPDLRLLPMRAAERRLAASDLRWHPAGEGTRVLAQEPSAGTAVERGTLVTLWLSPPADSGRRELPDLTGLSVRAALRRLAPHQVAARIVGKGTVVRQLPAAGTPLPIGGCVLYCEPTAGTSYAPESDVAADEKPMNDDARSRRTTHDRPGPTDATAAVAHAGPRAAGRERTP
jgi:cell division protein FtsI/penicillin-binding protein 2